MKLGSGWTPWLPLLAWLLLAIGCGVFAGPLIGLLTAAVGFALIAISRTHSLAQVKALSLQPDFDQFANHGDESVAALHQRLVAGREAAEALHGQVAAMRETLDLLPASILLLDASHSLVWANATAAEMLMIDRVNHVGKPITQLLTEPQLKTALQTDFGWPVEITMAREHSPRIEFSGVRNGAKGWLITAIDVSTARRIENMRRDFIANLAHELKTPLTVLAGFNETLDHYNDLTADERLEIFGHMQHQTSAMQRLVADLLALSRLESADDQAPMDTVVLSEVAARCIDVAVRVVAAPCKITSSGLAERSVFGATDEVESALGNLLINAVRHTPTDGMITVRLLDGADGALRIEVADTGMGISAEHLPRLTERFYRVDRGRSRSAGGTGLGLAIVKHVMHRHDGALEIRSEVGKGSVFTLVFPANRIVRKTQTD